MIKRTSLTGEEAKEFANRLLTANDTDKVVTTTEELETGYDVVWKPLGDDENNYSDVYTQASSPMGAFTEIPFNGEDSLMIRFYDHASEEWVDQRIDHTAYSSMKDAVESDWVDLDDAEVEIIADGRMPEEGNVLNLTVRDNGKGKKPEDFDDFVGLHAPGLKKQKYNFLQGQYGMGSTAVMQFCGDIEEEYNERAFKFIASASTEAPGEWSWTLIHDKPRKGQVEYLTVGGDFPTFDGTFGGALTEKFRENYPDKYDFDKNITVADPQEHGAFVKVFDYQTNATRSMITGGGFRRKFERAVVDSPFPIRLTDMRYNSKFPQSETRGFLPRLRDGKEHLLKGEEYITMDTGSETLGERNAHVLLFKSDNELEDVDTVGRGKDHFMAKTTRQKNGATPTGIQRDHAVMLTINGQTHGSKGEYFLKSLGYSKVAEDTVVIVEFDDLANLGMVNMFSPSRDTLKESPQAKKFIAALKDALKGSDLLSEEEDRRRARRSTTETTISTETFSEFVERNPEIGNFMTTGARIEAPRIRPTDDADSEGIPTTDNDGELVDENTTDGEGDEDGDGGDYVTPMLPTYFNPIWVYNPGSGEHELWDDSRGIMPVELPVDGRAIIRFETDAQQNYLAREVLSGSLNVSPSARFVSVELQDGLLTLTIEAATDAEPGDDFALTAELTRPDPSECDLIDDPADVFPTEDGADATDTAATDGGDAVDISPLTAMCTVEYTEAQEPDPSTPSDIADTDDDTDEDGESGTNADTEGDEGEENGQTEDWGFEMPDISFVWEENWRTNDDEEPIDEDKFDPAVAAAFDEHTLITLDASRDGTISGLGLTINMDAAPLRSFIVERNIKENWKEFVENQYKLAMVFFTITEYRDFVDEYGQTLEGSEIMITELIQRSINALGPALMPTIIPEDQLDRITE